MIVESEISHRHEIRILRHDAPTVLQLLRQHGAHPRQGRAEAEVAPGRERQVLARVLAVHVERVGVVEDLRVAIGCRQDGDDERPGGVNPLTAKYLNRLSDALFVFARYANAQGPGDVLWQPGGGR